jgi:hypothetical protein
MRRKNPFGSRRVGTKTDLTALGITVLQPNKCRTNIGRTMLGVVHDDRLFGTSRHEDLDGIVVIAVGALVERALDASPSASSRL